MGITVILHGKLLLPKSKRVSGTKGRGSEIIVPPESLKNTWKMALAVFKSVHIFLIRNSMTLRFLKLFWMGGRGANRPLYVFPYNFLTKF